MPLKDLAHTIGGEFYPEAQSVQETARLHIQQTTKASARINYLVNETGSCLDIGLVSPEAAFQAGEGFTTVRFSDEVIVNFRPGLVTVREIQLSKSCSIFKGGVGPEYIKREIGGLKYTKGTYQVGIDSREMMPTQNGLVFWAPIIKERKETGRGSIN